MSVFRMRYLSYVLASTTLATSAFAQAPAHRDLTHDPTLYAVGYAHLDTEWRWEYPQVIDEYLYRTMHDNFSLLDKYPHYIFNFSGANRYRMMQEYYPADFNRVKQYVAQGRWFPAGSSMEEGDVNAPNAEAIIRQILYGNDWFRKTFGVASEEYMLPDCFGFPASLPAILAHSGVKGFSTQKLTWGSSVDAGGPESLERTPEGTPFNVGVWVGPDGSKVLAAVNPGAYSGRITTDLSQPFPVPSSSPGMQDVDQRISALQGNVRETAAHDPSGLHQMFALREEKNALDAQRSLAADRRFQGDWAARVQNNGKVTGLFADYHYYGTGDIGGAPHEDSVRRLEAIVTKGTVDMPPVPGLYSTGRPQDSPTSQEQVGLGPVHVISATADQMFKDITPAAEANLPRYTGEMELTNHSAGSLTSQAYQKRWIRQEELLADAAEKSSLMAQWLGARSYPIERLNGAWTLAMAAHFHDLAAGTATPRSYQFAWNDDVIAMNQFSVVLKSATEGVSEALNTQTKGVPIVVFNQLNIPRQDVAEADVRFDGKLPKAVRVTAPDGTEVPAQVVDGKLLFLASVPSVGYAVYDVQEANSPAAASDLHVSEHQLENAYYRVTLNTAGDVESIFDKKLNRELLASPARLALSYDNPVQWPAWNMDWDQEQAAPREYVSGPAKVRIVENGPVRIALEVTRETGGSRFVQTIRLSTGDAGKRVEFANVIDWATRERNLKAVFPLTASNEMATYNWDIGTIERPSAKPKKFEVPSHQWIDLTDASGTFGATVLTDAKNGSDKPNDHTLRLTLIRTPGVAGGYPDQATQDIGHHEFLYGFAGHADGWRQAQTDWQGQRLNAPLLSFAADKHPGALGRSFSMLKISNPRVRVLGMKRAENSDEWILRMVELDGTPKENVRVALPVAITGAREVNGQEQPVGSATVENGELVTSFSGYQPRTFALHLASAPAAVATVQSTPIQLQYTAATATTTGSPTKDGFDSKGNSLPAEMLPQQLSFNGVDFHLAPAATGTPNAIVANGQTIRLPEGKFDRVYLLAAAANGDQEADFQVGSQRQHVKVEDWGGFIGQWDDRIWSSESAHGNYGQMLGLRPGFIKRADLAWYSDHHHDATGKNVAYRYSYLFAYALDVPAGARTLTLPRNPNIRILAASVANRSTEAMPLHPLYDVLPSATAGEPGFSVLMPTALSVAQGRAVSRRIVVLPHGSFDGHVKVGADHLPSGVTAEDSYDATTKAHLLTLHASNEAAAGEFPVRIVASSGEIHREEDIPLTVTPILRGTVPVDLGSAFNVTAIYKRGTKFGANAGADAGGYAFAEDTLGREQLGSGVVFHMGPAEAPDAVSAKTINLPAGHFASLRLLATAVQGNQRQQAFTIHYADGTSETSSLNVADWASNSSPRDESDDVEVPYRLTGNGTVDANPFHLRGYTLKTDSAKELKSISLPGNHNVLVFGVTLVPREQ